MKTHQTLIKNIFSNFMSINRSSLIGFLLLGVLILVLPLIVFVSQQQPQTQQHAASLFPKAPDTTTNIHVGLPAMTNIASGQSLLNANPPVDEEWNWNSGGSGNNYPSIYKGIYFPVDRQPDTRYNPGSQQISWFQANHPDWIEYQCDKTTIAYAFGQPEDIPLDTNNPAVLSWLESTFYAPAATSGNYQHLDFDNFQMTNGGSWSGQRCGHWTGAQGSSTWVQQYNGINNDPAYRSNEISMAQNLQSWLHAHYPNVIFAANFSFDNTYPTDSDNLMSHIDLLFDEQGFTNGNNGPPYYYVDSTWLAKAQHTWNFINAGHAWQDINQFGTSFSTLTTAQKQWALANYLLLKNNASWIYICGPQEYGTLLMSPEYTAQIGSPINTFYSSQNVYMRDFTNGLAIVNPSSTQSFTVNIPTNTYKDLYGSAKSSVTLGIHSGIVLLGNNPNITSVLSPTQSTITTPSSSTIFSVTLCPYGLGNCGDNLNANSGGNTSPLHLSRPVTLTILNASNQPVGTGQGNVTYNASSQNFQGTVSVPNLSPGSYLAIVKTDGFLPKQVPGITVGAQSIVHLPTISLVTGDINNDNQLDILDYNLLISCFGSKQTSPTCQTPPTAQTPGADINDDGKVDGVDFNLLLRELIVQQGDGGGTAPTPASALNPTATPTTSSNNTLTPTGK